MKTEKRKTSEYLFPLYRLWEDAPFGFWYVGFFAMVLSFFNLAINFFSHLALLLGHLTGTLPELPREPGVFDLILSGAFGFYYLVSVPLFFWYGASYWNFVVGIKEKLKRLFCVDLAVFLFYNLLYFVGAYLYKNPYLTLKILIYLPLMVIGIYFASTDADDKAKKVVGKG
jgi:hypothetical protein